MKQGPTAPDGFQKLNLLQRIVIFDNGKQMKQVQKELSDKKEYIKNQCTPSQEEIDQCHSLLSLDFNSKEREIQQSNLKHMCQEANVSQFIIRYLKSK